MKACSSVIAAHFVLGVAVLLHLPNSGRAAVYEFNMDMFRAYPIGTLVNDIPDWESQGWTVEHRGDPTHPDHLITCGRITAEPTWDRDTNYAIWSFHSPANEVFNEIIFGAWCYTGLPHEASASNLYMSISPDNTNWIERGVITPNKLVPYVEGLDSYDLQDLGIEGHSFYVRFQNDNQLEGGITGSVLNVNGRITTVPEPSLLAMLVFGMCLHRLKPRSR